MNSENAFRPTRIRLRRTKKWGSQQYSNQTGGTVTNRKLLSATALQTGAFILFASASPSYAQATSAAAAATTTTQTPPPAEPDSTTAAPPGAAGVAQASDSAGPA